MRELDWKVHEYMGNDLTGFTWYMSDETSSMSHTICKRRDERVGEVRSDFQDIPHYSTTWEGAGLVMEWLSKNIDSRFELAWMPELKTFRFGLGPPYALDYNDFAPLAICKAYISAMEERNNG